MELEIVSPACNNNVDYISRDYGPDFTTTQVFESREELLAWVFAVAQANGFVTVITRSERHREGNAPKLFVGCERSGQYKPQAGKDGGVSLSRKTATKKCNCPFKLQGLNEEGTDRWKLKVCHGMHNHKMADHFEGHEFSCRLTNLQKALVRTMVKSPGIMPRNIWSSIRQEFPGSTPNVKSIVNMKYNDKKREMGGLTRMQFLLKKLRDNHYVVFLRRDEAENRLTDIVWAHPTALRLVKNFPWVLVMDCTYRTNRYMLPLFECVGVTSTLKTFSVAHAFISSERQDRLELVLNHIRSFLPEDRLLRCIVTDRDFALMNAVRKLFPTSAQLLCTWHINENIIGNCKKHFPNEEGWQAFLLAWKHVLYSRTVPGYFNAVAQLRAQFNDCREVLGHLHGTWLIPHHHQFIQAWTDKVFHLGNTTTQRVESVHALMKKYIENCKVDLVGAWMGIHDAIMAQHSQIKESFERAKILPRHVYVAEKMYDLLRGKVSEEALGKIQKHKVLAKLDLRRDEVETFCRPCPIIAKKGLPCRHMIANWITQGVTIPLEVIHPHWRCLTDHAPAVNRASGNTVEEILHLLQDMDEAQQCGAFQMFIDYINPSQSSLNESTVRENNRGRPRSQSDHSTRHDPSWFEMSGSGSNSVCSSGISVGGTPETHTSMAGAPSQTPSSTTNMPSVTPTSRTTFASNGRLVSSGRGRGRGRVARNLLLDIYRVKWGSLIGSFIDNIIDVVKDGHCGFRCVAALCGNGEGAWRQVRRDLTRELEEHEALYATCWSQVGFVQELIRTCRCSAPQAPESNWMELPALGPVIASCYDVVVHSISLTECHTYLPMRSAPIPMGARGHITLGLVNDNHWVQVFWKEPHPVPPILEMCIHQRLNIAQGWEDAYVDGIQLWHDMSTLT